jgi:hypothetical protein
VGGSDENSLASHSIIILRDVSTAGGLSSCRSAGDVSRRLMARVILVVPGSSERALGSPFPPSAGITF